MVITEAYYITALMAVSSVSQCALNVTLFLFQGGSCIEPSSVFKVYTEKLFWEGEQKRKDSEAEQPVSDCQIILLPLRYFEVYFLHHLSHFTDDVSSL